MYPSYLFQFYSNYRARLGELALIGAVNQIQKSGGDVWANNVFEHDNSILIAFSSDFSERFALKRSPVHLITSDHSPPPGSYVVNPSKTNDNDLEVYAAIGSPVSTFYSSVVKFHKFVTFGGDQSPLCDCGSPGGVGDAFGRIVMIGGKK